MAWATQQADEKRAIKKSEEGLAASCSTGTVSGRLQPLLALSNAVLRQDEFDTVAAHHAAPVPRTLSVIYFFIDASDSLTATCQMIKPNAILFNTSAAL